MTVQQARALQATTNRFHQADVNLRNAKDDGVTLQAAEEYLAAREAHQGQIEAAAGTEE